MSESLAELTADILSAYVAHNEIPGSALPALIQSVHAALAGVGTPVLPVAVQAPAVSLRASVKPDQLICLECGQKLKMLKRHLATHHGLTTADYRAKWSLGADYPMVTASYADVRKTLALSIGLGTKRNRPKGKVPATTKSAVKAKAKPKAASKA